MKLEYTIFMDLFKIVILMYSLFIYQWTKVLFKVQFSFCFTSYCASFSSLLYSIMNGAKELWNENIQSTVSQLNFVLCSPVLQVLTNPLIKENAFAETNGKNINCKVYFSLGKIKVF